MKRLEPNHITFCEAYLRGLVGKKVSLTDAYMEAYPECTRDSAYACASKLMTHDIIKDYLKERMATMTLSTNEVLMRLAKLAQEADKDSDKLRALELIGKTQGMFVDRTDITSNGQSMSLIDYLSVVKATEKPAEKSKSKSDTGTYVVDGYTA